MTSSNKSVNHVDDYLCCHLIKKIFVQFGYPAILFTGFQRLPKCLAFPIFILCAYLRKVVSKTRRAHYIRYLRFHFYTWSIALLLDSSPRWYRLPSSQCLGTDMIYNTYLDLKFSFQNYVINSN